VTGTSLTCIDARPAPGVMSMLSDAIAVVQKSPLGAMPGLKSLIWLPGPGS
jgi:hypothetical protein